MTTTYQIKALADRTGFSPATLRYYEEIGLLPSPARTAAGYRTYDETAVARLSFVARAKQLGCTLEEIGALASAWDGGECGPVQDRLRRLVDGKISAAQDRIVELMTFTAELQAAASALATPRPDGPCDDGCGCVSAPALGPDVATAASSDASRAAVATADAGTTDQAVRLARRPDACPDAPAIACTLAPSDYHGRLDHWHRVLAGVARRERAGDGALRVVFRPGTELGELARLAVAEHDCCRFFSFTITVDERGLALEVRAPDGAGDLVAAVFGVAA